MKRDESSAYTWESAMSFRWNAVSDINCQAPFHFDSSLSLSTFFSFFPPSPSNSSLLSLSFGGCYRKFFPLHLLHRIPYFVIASLSLTVWKSVPWTRLFPFPRPQSVHFTDAFFSWKDLPHGSRNRWASFPPPHPPSHSAFYPLLFFHLLLVLTEFSVSPWTLSR